MARFKMVEETYAYREYTIEADSFEDAKRKWEDYDKDLEVASDYVPWDVSTDDTRLDYMVNEETDEIKYCD